MKKILKNFYTLIPAKKVIFSFIKIFWTPPHSVYKHLYFNGIFNVRIPGTKGFKLMHHSTEIENDIFWQGLTEGWEKRSMKLWIQLCRTSKVILDIGANTGIYSLTANAVNESATIYAFEPLHRIYQKLKRNNELNHFHIVCIEKALSDREGQQVIYENDGPHVNAATLNQYTAEKYGKGLLNKRTVISTTTLDNFIETENLPKVDLIKLDVETHEPQVIEGYKQYIKLHKPAFLIEVLSDDVGEKLQELFDPLEYFYFNIDDKNDCIRRVDGIRKSDYFNYLICPGETADNIKATLS